jgi:putative membrane protein
MIIAVWCGYGWGAGHWFVVFPLLFIAAIVVALAFGLRRRRWGSWHSESGEAILGERYARGEISEEEYRQRLGVFRQRSR